jgi:hypothetical protein
MMSAPIFSEYLALGRRLQARNYPELGAVGYAGQELAQLHDFQRPGACEVFFCLGRLFCLSLHEILSKICQNYSALFHIGKACLLQHLQVIVEHGASGGLFDLNSSSLLLYQHGHYLPSRGVGHGIAHELYLSGRSGHFTSPC